MPGLVRLIVVPAKSSTPSLPVRARRTRSSYADQNPVKSMDLGSLDRRDEKLSGAVRLGDVDRKAEVDVLGAWR